MAKFRLTPVRGQTRTVELTGPISIGRGPENVVPLLDEKASRRHCTIEPLGDAAWIVRDLGSRNGTWLNGHRVRYAELRPGDALRAGGTELVFRTADDGIARGEGPA